MITEQLIQFGEQHKAAVTVASMWVVRELHVIWPRLVAIFPYCRDNGGAVGIAKQFLFGRAEARPATAASQPETHKPIE